MDAEWRSIVRYEYNKIIKSRESKHTDKVNNVWKKNRRKIFEFKATLNERKSVWQEGESSKYAEETIAVCTNEDGEPQKCPIVEINPIKPIPSSYFWTPIRENIRVDDEVVLNHIPYMGHEVFEDNDTFLQDLLQHYDGKVHGESGALDDDLFVNLVHSLVKYENSLTSKIQRPRKSEVSDNAVVHLTRFPSINIFKAISAIFSDKGTPEDFLKKYLRLTEASYISAVKASPNIDSLDCKSLSREQALNSYQKYFCRRCFKYNCILHRAKNDLEQKKVIGPRLELFNDPCSENCYLHKKEVKEKLLINGRNDSREERNHTEESANQYCEDFNNNNDGDENTQGDGCETADESFDHLKYEEEESEIIAKKDVEVNKHSKFTLSEIDGRKEAWSGSEETLFRALYPAFPENLCAIAQIIQTKTCQDVYEFALGEGHDIPSGKVYDLSSPRVLRTKQSVWSIRLRKKQLMKNSKKNYLYSYELCDHPGQNCDETCPCVDSQNFCEKFCKCSRECKNRYPGCNCKAQCNTKQCPCIIAVRECDPDLCQTCGADQFHVTQISCKNVNIQRGLHKHLLMAPSDVAGWGIFLKGSAIKNEFISEYCGEIISQDEADRRGKIYDKYMCSFLFNLNNDFVVDATRRGNKIRFANHSINPNCYAKVMMVNGDHRIGIFAKRAIQPDEELFLDYRYGTTEQLKFVGIERKAEKLHQENNSKCSSHAPINNPSTPNSTFTNNSK